MILSQPLGFSPRIACRTIRAGCVVNPLAEADGY
jgi:hypothetical protein